MKQDPMIMSRNDMKRQREKSYSQLDTSSIEQKRKGTSMGADTASSSSEMSTANKAQLAAAGVQMGAAALGAEETDATAGAVTMAASGAATGAALGGPWGAAIGGVVGGIAGGLSAESKRKAQNRQIKANMLSNQGRISQQKAQADAQILGGLAANLSRTLV